MTNRENLDFQKKYEIVRAESKRVSDIQERERLNGEYFSFRLGYQTLNLEPNIFKWQKLLHFHFSILPNFSNLKRFTTDDISSSEVPKSIL